MLQLASNENPLGMSDAARAAAAGAMAQASWYPDADGTLLKCELSSRFGVDAAGITLGCGSSELLEMAARACVQPGEGIVYSQYGFVVYGLAAAHVHARATVVPAQSFGHDLQAMLEAVRPDTRLLFVANPNNPTGSFIGGRDLLAFIERVPAHVAVLLDEAYIEFLSPVQHYDSLQWVARFPNLLVTRTFSKAYGLAGLRIGYGVSQPAFAARLNAQRPRFNVTTPAIAAATAALRDTAFVERTARVNAQGRDQLTSGCEALGLQCLPSAGNFVMVRVGDGAHVQRALLEHGIAVAPLDNYALAPWVRISVGLPEQNAQVLAALRALAIPSTKETA